MPDEVKEELTSVLTGMERLTEDVPYTQVHSQMRGGDAWFAIILSEIIWAMMSR